MLFMKNRAIIVSIKGESTFFYFLLKCFIILKLWLTSVHVTTDWAENTHHMGKDRCMAMSLQFNKIGFDQKLCSLVCYEAVEFLILVKLETSRTVILPQSVSVRSAERCLCNRYTFLSQITLTSSLANCQAIVLTIVGSEIHGLCQFATGICCESVLSVNFIQRWF